MIASGTETGSQLCFIITMRHCIVIIKLDFEGKLKEECDIALWPTFVPVERNFLHIWHAVKWDHVGFRPLTYTL